MGMMNKLRDNTGIVLWVLVFAFGVIWVLQDSGGLDVVGRGAGANVAVIDGQPITYELYSQAVERQLQEYQAQTGESMPPQMVDVTRDRVFDALVEDRLREREIERLGIEVTDDELYNMVMGDDPHPIIRTYFGDGEGGINRTLLQNFIENPDVSGEWLQLEQFLRSERRREKLDNLVAATVRVSDQEVQDEYVRRGLRVDAEYVALRHAEIPDDSVAVTARDVERFYRENREDFRRKEAYTVNYVGLSKDPTPEDSALVITELERLRERFVAAEDDSLFLVRNLSDRPYTDAYFRADELDEELATPIFESLEPGRLIGPIVAASETHLIKIQSVQPAESPAVRAQHILFRAEENNPEARSTAREAAAEARRRLQAGEDFSDLARELSQDPGSAARGGDLGYFSSGAMVEPFEQAAFGARIGQVVGPIETPFGVHLIKVTDRQDQEVQIADLAHRIRADLSTLSRIQERLDDLQYYASESGDFGAEAQRVNLPTQQVQVQADQEFIPGLGSSATIMNFLRGASSGDVSPVIELDDQFVVLHVQERIPEGYRPLDQVRAEIEPRVRNAKKAAVQRERLQRALNQTGFDGLASAVRQEMRIAQGLTHTGMVVTGLGREPKFVGTALGLPEGGISDVIEGANAVYVLRVSARHEPPPIADSQKEQIRNQLVQQRRSALQSQWLSTLRGQAEIEDHRSVFQQL